MNERNRLREAFDRNMSREDRVRTAVPPAKRDWVSVISIVIATSAFALTVFTTYLSTFRAVDDVRVVLNTKQYIGHKNGSQLASVADMGVISFTNAGNRDAAIQYSGW
jgi:hypothetical protein